MESGDSDRRRSGHDSRNWMRSRSAHSAGESRNEPGDHVRLRKSTLSEPRDRSPARAASILAMSIFFASSIRTCPCASRTRSPGCRRQRSHSSNQLVDALSNLGFVGHPVWHAHLVVASPARPKTAKPPLIFTFESSETTLGSGHPLHSARREKGNHRSYNRHERRSPGVARRVAEV